MGASVPLPSPGFAGSVTTERRGRSPPGQPRHSARRSHVLPPAEPGSDGHADGGAWRAAGPAVPREGRPGVRPELAWPRYGGPPRRRLPQAAKPSKPPIRPAQAGRSLSAKPDLPGGLVRQEPPPTHSGEESPPEATEEKPSSKTPPPQHRPTSAPEAWAPPPAHSHWPSSPRLRRSTGPGGMFSILLDKKTIYYRFETRFFPVPPTLASSSSRLPARRAVCGPGCARPLGSCGLLGDCRLGASGALILATHLWATRRSWTLVQYRRSAARIPGPTPAPLRA